MSSTSFASAAGRRITSSMVLKRLVAWFSQLNPLLQYWILLQTFFQNVYAMLHKSKSNFFSHVFTNCVFVSVHLIWGILMQSAEGNYNWNQ